MNGEASGDGAFVDYSSRVKAGVKRTAIALTLLALVIYVGFYLLMASA